MTARTFGRKGLAGDDVAMARRRDAFSAEERARQRLAPQDSEDAEMARRREAFLAEERARNQRLQESGGSGAIDPTPATGGAAPAYPVIVREKSMGAAYALWLVAGGVSAHRFYLGYPVSGAIQGGVWMVSWLMVLSGFLVAFPIMLFAGLSILGDLAAIPKLCRQANERARRQAVPYVFA